MPVSYDEAAQQLRKLYKEQFDLQEEMDRLTDTASSAESDDLAVNYVRRIAAKKQQIRAYLEQDLVRFPPHHYARNLAALQEFHRVAPYEKSVFIMTKFPEGKAGEKSGDARNEALRSVIEAVQAGIRAAGMTPRLATFSYQDMLWPNVELFLLGCSRGVAIVEDQYRAELNPNVALEWGWMKGMGKRVYFLMESKFAHGRADWQGFLSKEFSWDDPEAGIKEAIAEWLTGKEEV